MADKITLNCKLKDGKILTITISRNKTIQDLKNEIKKRIECNDLDLYFNKKKLDLSKTIKESGLKNNDLIYIKNENRRFPECYIIENTEKKIEYKEEGLKREVENLNIEDKGKEENGYQNYEDYEQRQINIKFLMLPSKNKAPNSEIELTSLLKLCLLKELSTKIDPDLESQLSDVVNLIFKILKNGYSEQTKDVKKDIGIILEKVKGSNIINFSRFVDNTIDSELLNTLIAILNDDQQRTISDIKNRLARYDKDIKVFDKEFPKAMKDSIIEFSVISLAIIEREDFETYEKEKKNCQNRVERLLFHGTGEEPVACILTGVFKKSINKCYQHGRGVYFSDMLDYCWFYGDKTNNRANMNKIPKKDETFTLIACSTYYDKKGYKHVYDSSRDPTKNQINFAYADAEFETILDKTPDKTKFYGTEYVIWELAQICPFIGAKLKRVEFCCIWRDNNFSPKAIHNPKFDKLFKEFLKERMRYIEQYAEFNIYPCETSEEALKLIKRKKYNKIILLSNIGQDLGGKKFVEEAREILENDVVVLFSAYDINHLDWVKKYKNALFSNEPYIFEEYLKCFSPNFSEDDKKKNILNLKSKVESYYKVRFNFDEDFLEYPLYKSSGKYSDLTFE